jgi:hypothetical protein
MVGYVQSSDLLFEILLTSLLKIMQHCMKISKVST